MNDTTDQASARRALLQVGAALAGAAALTAASGGPASAARSTAVPLTSGTAGRWTTMVHRRSTPEADAVVARHPRGVRLVGDSIAYLMLPHLERYLTAEDRPLSYDTWAGRPTPACAAAVEAAGGLLAPVLVVVSGANDIFDPGRFAGAVTTLLEMTPSSTRVLWVTPYVGRPRYLAADNRNSALACLALERAAAVDDRLELVRWYEFLALKPTRLAMYVPDGVHPGPRGMPALMSLLTPRLG